MIYLDTHVVAWLYAGETARFPKKASAAIEAEECLISPVVLLELQHLRETRRLQADPGALYEYLAETIGLKICELPFKRITLEALPLDWTRDPFDRLITATAIAGKRRLLTKDRSILSHFRDAFWE